MWHKLVVTGLLLAAMAGPAAADDIDLYLDQPARGGSYVHLLLDYRPALHEALCRYGDSCLPPFMSEQAYRNLSARAPGEPVSRMEVLQAVLATVLDQPGLEDVHLALLASNRDGGATLLKGYRRLGEGGAGEILSALGAIPAPRDAGAAHPLQVMAAYFEWFRYLNGGAVALGANTAGNFNGSETPGLDRSAVAGSAEDLRYLSPFQAPRRPPMPCTRLFSLLVTAGPAAGERPLRREIAAELGRAAARDVPAMLRYLHGEDTDLVRATGDSGVQPLRGSWVIATPGGWDAASAWAAAVGSGGPLPLDDPPALERGLRSAFGDVAARGGGSGVGAGVGMGKGAGVGESPDSLYLALFEPRATLRWPGNIKKLRFAGMGAGADRRIVDVRGRPALTLSETGGGRIAADALTFWTDPEQLPPASHPAAAANADGPAVTRGGAGQRIPGFVAGGAYSIGDANGTGARRLFIEPAAVTNGGDNPLLPFNADRTTLALAPYLPAALGTGNPAETLSLIRWARGLDEDDADGDGNTAEPRAWLLGDVLHSRPLALNYGAVAGHGAGNPAVRLFFGSGDGIFHMLEDTDAAGRESGRELYGFLPREVLGTLAAKRMNTAPAARMRYGVDGAPVALTRDVDGDGKLEAPAGDEAYVYFGLRRGGASYYALDVSDPAAPPRLKWKISRTRGGDFDELGMTFSEPVVGRVRYRQAARDVVIFAGGYHGGWSGDGGARIGKDAGAGDDPVGNALYIVDARSGELVWKAVYGPDTGSAGNREYRHAELVDSIPSKVSVLRDNSGLIHRLYVGDTGGALWRVDLPPGEGEGHRARHWFITRLAELGSDGPDTDRRFFHAPDLVRAADGEGRAFDGVLIASGNRAAPNGREVRNYLFYLRDYAVNSGDDAVRRRPSLTPGDLADRSACVDGGAGCAAPSPAGWRLALEREGEKGLSTPLTEAGRVVFSTYTPPPPARDGRHCAPVEGRGALYSVKLEDGSAAGGGRRYRDIGSGIPPEPVLAGEAILLPGSGGEAPSAGGAGNGGKLAPLAGDTLFRVYWREPEADDL